MADSSPSSKPDGDSNIVRLVRGALRKIFENLEVVWTVAGIFAILATLISLYQIVLHLRWNANSALRKYVLRILMMVPVYALESWLGLRFTETAAFFDTMRDCYESMVIYSFYCFLVGYLGGERELIRTLRRKPQQPHISPFCCLAEWKMGQEFLFKCKLGILQFVVLKPLMAVIAFAFDSLGMYYTGEIVAYEAYPYIVFIDNVSQTVALYCLILFYLAVSEELAPINPVPKFFVVKAVVFFTWWQDLALTLLVKVGLITNTSTFSADELITIMQDFLVCVEMFVASMAHHWAFSYKEFYDPVGRPRSRPIMRGLFQAVDVTDVFLDDVDAALNPHHSAEDHDHSPMQGAVDASGIAVPPPESKRLTFLGPRERRRKSKKRSKRRRQPRSSIQQQHGEDMMMVRRRRDAQKQQDQARQQATPVDLTNAAPVGSPSSILRSVSVDVQQQQLQLSDDQSSCSYEDEVELRNPPLPWTVSVVKSKK